MKYARRGMRDHVQYDLLSQNIRNSVFLISGAGIGLGSVMDGIMVEYQYARVEHPTLTRLLSFHWSR